MKKIYFTIVLLFVLQLSIFAQHLDVGDFRSVASGNWSAVTTWQVRTAANTWSPASGIPSSTSSVFIQNGHTVTVDIAEANCDSLNISNSTAPDNGVLNLGANTLNVYGKLRAFTQTAISSSSTDGNIPGTSTGTMLATGTITGTGKIKLVGDSRFLTYTGEWGVGPHSWRVEFALNPGASGTLQTGFKAGSITVSSGEITANNGFRVDSSNVGTGVLTITNGGYLKLTSNANLQRLFAASATSHFRLLDLQVGGTLEFTNIVGVIGASAINLDGVVLYSSSSPQTLVTKGGNSAGVDPFTYRNLQLYNSAKTFSGNTSVIDSLTIRSLGGNIASVNLSGFTLNYGSSATLLYRGLGTPTPQQTTSDAEWPSSGSMPAKVCVYNPSGVVLNGNKYLSDSLYFLGVGTKLIMSNFNLSAMGVNGATNSRYCVTNGSGRLTIRNVQNTPTLFPVGTSQTSYQPVIITNSGNADAFSVSVSTGIPCGGLANETVNCIWNISESVPGSSNSTVMLQWNASDENAGFNRNNCAVIGCTGGVVNSSGSLSVASGTGPYQQVSSTVNSFDQFGVSNSANNGVDVTPVSLVTPSNGGCKTGAEQVSVSIKNNAALPLNFSLNPLTVTVTESGGYNSSIVVSSGILAPGVATTVILPSTINMSAGGNFIFNVSTSASGDQNASNDNLSNINISGLPGPDASIAYASSTFCSNSTGNQNVVLTGTQNGVFNATPSGLTISGANGTVQPSSSIPGSYQITYTIPASNGCNVFTTSTTINITSASTPPIEALSSISNSCSPVAVSLSLNGGTLSSTANWVWYKDACGSGTAIGSGSQLNNIQTDVTTTYYVRSEGSGACDATDCVAVTVTINEPIEVTMQLSGNAVLLPGQTALLTAVVTPIQSGYSYNWYKNGVYYASTSVPELSVGIDNVGAYYVEVVSQQGCNGISNIIVLTEGFSPQLYVYPNPSNGHFNVSYYNERLVPVVRYVELYDMKGAKVLKQKFVVSGRFSSMPVDAAVLSSGVYTLVLTRSDGKKLVSGKIVIKK